MYFLYSAQVVANAKHLAEQLKDKGYKLAANGTENHLILIDLRATDEELTGKEAAVWLETAGIITNMNTVPKETRSPFKTSGIRLGTPALTTRSFKEDQFTTVADLLDRVLTSKGDEAVLKQVRDDVIELCKQFPMPH